MLFRAEFRGSRRTVPVARGWQDLQDAIRRRPGAESADSSPDLSGEPFRGRAGAHAEFVWRGSLRQWVIRIREGVKCPAGQKRSYSARIGCALERYPRVGLATPIPARRMRFGTFGAAPDAEPWRSFRGIGRSASDRWSSWSVNCRSRLGSDSGKSRATRSQGADRAPCLPARDVGSPLSSHRFAPAGAGLELPRCQRTVRRRGLEPMARARR